MVKKNGFCVIIASEGVKNSNGKFLAESDSTDAFGHSQLGGVAPRIAGIVNKQLGLKYHWAVSDYLQRSARHIGSKIDVEQAYMLGKSGIEYAKKNNISYKVIE